MHDARNVRASCTRSPNESFVHCFPVDGKFVDENYRKNKTDAQVYSVYKLCISPWRAIRPRAFFFFCIPCPQEDHKIPLQSVPCVQNEILQWIPGAKVVKKRHTRTAFHPMKFARIVLKMPQIQETSSMYLFHSINEARCGGCQGWLTPKDETACSVCKKISHDFCKKAGVCSSCSAKEIERPKPQKASITKKTPPRYVFFLFFFSNTRSRAQRTNISCIVHESLTLFLFSNRRSRA